MKDLKIALPQEEDYFKLNSDQQDKLLGEIKNVLQEVDVAITQLAAIRLIPIFEKHHEIETITLDPTYEYNDEGYAPNYIMPWINDNYDTYSSEEHEDEWRSEIEDVLGDIASLIHKEVLIDRQNTLIKHRKETLENQLETKTDIKNRFKV